VVRVQRRAPWSIRQVAAAANGPSGHVGSRIASLEATLIVEHLLGIRPPDWKAPAAKTTTTASGQ